MDKSESFDFEQGVRQGETLSAAMYEIYVH